MHFFLLCVSLACVANGKRNDDDVDKHVEVDVGANVMTTQATCSSAQAAQVPQLKAGEERVEILFIRHGHACHNALKHQGNIKAHCTYPDPPLTDCGVQNTIENKKVILKAMKTIPTYNEHAKNKCTLGWTPDKVGSSAMVRAMETATLIFDKQTIYPIPFVKELEAGAPYSYLTACNTPVVQADQVKSSTVMKKAWANGTLDFTYLDFQGTWQVGDPAIHRRVSWFSGGHSTSWTSEEARKKNLFKEFRAYLAEKVLPSIPAKDGVVRLALVSHSNIMTHIMDKYFYTNCSEAKKKGEKENLVKWRNNDAKLLSFDYQRKTDASKSLLREVPMKACEAPPGTGTADHLATWGKSTKYLCAKDYGTCMEPERDSEWAPLLSDGLRHKGSYWMGLEETGKPGERSPYVNIAADKGLSMLTSACCTA